MNSWSYWRPRLLYILIHVVHGAIGAMAAYTAQHWSGMDLGSWGPLVAVLVAEISRNGAMLVHEQVSPPK